MIALLLWKGPTWCWYTTATIFGFFRAVVTIQMLVITPLVFLMLIAPLWFPPSSSINSSSKGEVERPQVQDARTIPQKPMPRRYVLENGAVVYDATP